MYDNGAFVVGKNEYVCIRACLWCIPTSHVHVAHYPTHYISPPCPRMNKFIRRRSTDVLKRRQVFSWLSRDLKQTLVFRENISWANFKRWVRLAGRKMGTMKSKLALISHLRYILYLYVHACLYKIEKLEMYFIFSLSDFKNSITETVINNLETLQLLCA